MAYRINGIIRLANNGDANLGLTTATEFDGKVSKKAITEQTAGVEADVTGADELLVYDQQSDSLLRVSVDDFISASGIGTIVTSFSQLNVTGVVTASGFDGDGSNLSDVAAVSLPSLEDIGNVEVTNAGIGSALVWNGTNWVGESATNISPAGALVLGYRFSSSTTMADPGNGRLRVNNSNQYQATQMAVDVDTRTFGADMSNFLLRAVKGTRLVLQKSDDAEKVTIYVVNEDPVLQGNATSGWVSFPDITSIFSTQDNITNNSDCMLALSFPNQLENVNINPSHVTTPTIQVTATSGIGMTVTSDVSIGGSTTSNKFYGELEGNVTGNLFGNSTGDHDGDVYSRDGSQLVLQVPASTGDATYTGNVTGDVTGDLTGDSSGTHTGQTNGDVYTADGATQVVDTAAAPAPVFKGDAEGLTGSPNISVGNVSAASSVTAVDSYVTNALTINFIETIDDSIKIGKAAGGNETVDGGNIFIGLNAGEGALTATRSTFVGKTAGFGADGDGNTYIGADTASANVGQTAVSNTAVGAAALNKIESGGSNVVAGVAAGNRVSSGNANTLIGAGAGEFITTGSNNIVLGGGSNTGATNVSNHIVIGNNVASPATLGDHLTIGNGSNSWIQGAPDFNIRTGLIRQNGMDYEYLDPATTTRFIYRQANHVYSSINIQASTGGVILDSFDLSLYTSFDVHVKWASNDGSRGFDRVTFVWDGSNIVGTVPPTSAAFAFNQLRAEVLFQGTNGVNTNLPFYTATGSVLGVAFQSNAGPLVASNTVVAYDAGLFPPAP